MPKRSDEEVEEDEVLESDVVASPVPQVQPKQRKLMLSKYTIYLTNQRMYIVGSNNRETMFRVVEIDITQPFSETLSMIEDNVFFTRNEIMKVLSGLEETSEGGLTKVLTALGLLGFIRFTQNWYLVVITKKSAVSILGGHYLYHIDATELIPVCNNYKKPDRNSEETRYLQTFSNLDLSKTFYYSYTYDLTNSLQTNFINSKTQSLAPDDHINSGYNEMFVWNSFLLKPIIEASFERIYDWFQPIIHGFIDQAKISIFDAKVYITIIARRSHHFAGARFLKRGVNDQGNVANEVETEQIVHDQLTSSFHDPSGGFYNNPRYTSYIQHRGSIPLSWSQEIGSNIKFQTKPPININVVDPFYSAAALHFDGLFKRYGGPILILNLIKQREKNPRESKLSLIFEECITYLNKFLPQNKELSYTAWDMSRASKNRGQEVIEYLERFADETLQKTGIFHNGLNLKTTQVQQGVCRTNCIDCLDRTNAAQFIIGKKALGYQLYALGVIDDKYLEYDSDVVNILTEMFHDHGDTIALQYGGSHLVNTMETYRKINQWTSHSRDMIESIKRFYSNSFIDAQRQEAINLFLGNFVWEKGLPMLWDLNTDYYLHHDFLGTNLKLKPSYTHWYTDSNLVDLNKSIIKFLEKNNPVELERDWIIQKYQAYPGFYENYFIELYIPRLYSSLNEVFEYNMNSTLRYMGESQVNSKDQSSPGPKVNEEELRDINNLNYLTSPFETRKPQLINSKLKSVKSTKGDEASKLKGSADYEFFDEEDEFKLSKLQISQFFSNVEEEYIYHQLNLKKFLDQQSPKMISHILREDGEYPVFDDDINSSKKPSLFHNFNLDGFPKLNREFETIKKDDSSDYGYKRSASVGTVALTDEIFYFNCINSIRNLSLSDDTFLTNEYSTEYQNLQISKPDLDLYSDYYKLNNIGSRTLVEDRQLYLDVKTEEFLPEEDLENDYFESNTDQVDGVSMVSSKSSLQQVYSNESESLFNNDYVLKEASLETQYDQFPIIQDELEEEVNESLEIAEEFHDQDDDINDTVIHNENNMGQPFLPSEELGFI